MTEEGYFVGVQHPMVLIIRSRDMKLISCSKKKFVVYESSYVAPLSYSPSELGRTVIVDASSSVDSDRVNAVTRSANPSHVQSIKSVSSHTIPIPNTTGPNLFRPPTQLDASAESQNPDQGEGLVVPEHTTYDSDLASGIAKLKEAAKAFVKEPGIRDKVIKAIEATKKLSGGVIEPNQLRKGKKINGNVDVENILREKRVPEICRFVVGVGVSVGS
jgi:hypothetical protein